MNNTWKQLFKDPDKLKAWMELGSTAVSIVIKAIQYFSK